MPESPDAEFLRRTWEAVTKGRFADVHAALAPDARWRIGPGERWNSSSRDEIIEMLAANLSAGGPARGEIEVAEAVGGRTLVGFRPGGTTGRRPLEDGLAWIVVTVEDGLVAEITACDGRAAAIDYAGAGDDAE